MLNFRCNLQNNSVKTVTELTITDIGISESETISSTRTKRTNGVETPVRLVAIMTRDGKHLLLCVERVERAI